MRGQGNGREDVCWGEGGVWVACILATGKEAGLVALSLKVNLIGPTS